MKIIIDIDGTLACGLHREHLINSKPANWTAYFKLCHLDSPIKPVVQLVKDLMYHGGNQVRFVSGRSDECREATVTWLAKHLGFPEKYIDERLFMRKAGDYTPDDIMKEKILKEEFIAKDWHPDLAIDDRQKVVNMWRRNEIVCLQPRPGDF